MNLKNSNKAIMRLNLVLRTLKKVNQRLVRERDPKRLLQGICNILIENRGYFNAWIALLDETRKLITIAEAGLGDEFLPMAEQLKQGELAQCARKAIVQAEVVLIKDPVSTCTDCPLSGNYVGREAMTIRLEHDGKVYGLLCASVPTGVTANKEEIDLFQEVADDVAFALTNIE
jgi:GAF domain-containing protein